MYRTLVAPMCFLKFIAGTPRDSIELVDSVSVSGEFSCSCVLLLVSSCFSCFCGEFRIYSITRCSSFLRSVSSSVSLSYSSMRSQSILLLRWFRVISIRFISALWYLGGLYFFQTPFDVLYSPGLTNSFQRFVKFSVSSE